MLLYLYSTTMFKIGSSVTRYIVSNVLSTLQWCEPVNVSTQAVAPGQCHAPKLQGKPKATSLHLRWSKYIMSGSRGEDLFKALFCKTHGSTYL